MPKPVTVDVLRFRKRIKSGDVMKLLGVTQKELKKLRDTNAIVYTNVNDEYPEDRASYYYHIEDVIDYMDAHGIRANYYVHLTSSKGDVNLSC